MSVSIGPFAEHVSVVLPRRSSYEQLPRVAAEDYYVAEWELGYGRSISLNHGFLGGDALLSAKHDAWRTRHHVELDRR